MATVIITISESEILAVDGDTGESWQVEVDGKFEITPSPVEITITKNETIPG